jgi:hypothetical protein
MGIGVARRADSLGGIIMAKLDRLPRSGGEVTLGAPRVRVEGMLRRMTAARLLPALAVLALLSTGCAHGRYGPKPPGEVVKPPRTLKKLTVAEREAILQRAQAWEAIDTSSLDLLAGPAVRDGFALDEMVTCDYVRPSEPPSGNTPKFSCRLAEDDVVRVKYGLDNGEVYAEVAATRLLWALGFHVDRAYPVRLTCRNCSPDPWEEPAERPGASPVFELAVIEREHPGRDVEVPGFEGWAWPELERVDESRGGAPRAHRDALKLAAAFTQHSDSKPEQQRLACAPDKRGRDAEGNETCELSFLVVNDLGATFGKAELFNRSKMTLAHWESRPIWRDKDRCIAHVKRSLTGTLKHPRIGEAGRQLLARQLSQLSDKQIRDLFTASRVERRGETIRGRDGRKRAVTVADWARVFKDKRTAIVEHRCPE